MLAHPQEIVAVMLVALRLMHELTCGHRMHYVINYELRAKGVNS